MARDCYATICWTCQGVGTHSQTCSRPKWNPSQSKGQGKGGKQDSKGKSKGKGKATEKSSGKEEKQQQSEPLLAYTEETSWDDKRKWDLRESYDKEGTPLRYLQEVTEIEFKESQEEKGSRFRALAAMNKEEENVTLRTLIYSRAAENVIPVNHELVRKDMLRNSDKSGVVYASATGERTANRGKVRVQITTRNERKGELNYQLAQVSQPLTSVERLCDLGNTITFNSSGGRMINNRTQNVTRIDRRGGVHVLEVEAKARKAPLQVSHERTARPLSQEIAGLED